MAYQIPAFDTPNRQPTDINPLDATLASDPQAAAIWSKVRGDMTALAGMFGQLNSQADSLFQRVVQIEGDSRLTAAAQASDLAQARNTFQKNVATLRSTAEAARGRILDTTTPLIDVSGFTRGSTSQDTLVLIERTRDAWARVCMILDRADDGQVLTKALDLGKRAAERDDTFTISALRQNLDAYLESRGHRQDHAQLVLALNNALGKTASPEMRAAMVIQTTLDAGWKNLQAAFMVAQGYGSSKTPMRVSGLPGWPGQPDVTI